MPSYHFACCNCNGVFTREDGCPFCGHHACGECEPTTNEYASGTGRLFYRYCLTKGGKSQKRNETLHKVDCSTVVLQPPAVNTVSKKAKRAARAAAKASAAKSTEDAPPAAEGAAGPVEDDEFEVIFKEDDAPEAEA